MHPLIFQYFKPKALKNILIMDISWIYVLGIYMISLHCLKSNRKIVIYVKNTVEISKNAFYIRVP